MKGNQKQGKLPKYTCEQVERDGVQAVGNFLGTPRQGWIMNDTEFVDYAGYAQIVIPVSEGVDVKREIWHLSSATSVDKAFHEARKVPEVDPNHTEIAAEFARLRALAPGWRPTTLRESVIDTFSTKWGMPKDEVAEIVDWFIAGSQRKPPKVVEPNQASCEAAAKAVQTHTDKLGIEGDPETQVWHLLVSLHEYCAVNGIDLDAQFADVRQQIVSGQVQSPKWIDANRSSTLECSASPRV